jgi:hypothetical protein
MWWSGQVPQSSKDGTSPKFHLSRTGVWNSLFRILWEFLTLLEVAKKRKILTCVPEIEFQSSRRQPVVLLPWISTFHLRSNYWVKLETACRKVRTQTAQLKSLLTGDQLLTIRLIIQKCIPSYLFDITWKCLCESGRMCPSNFLEFSCSNSNRCNNTGTWPFRI